MEEVKGEIDIHIDAITANPDLDFKVEFYCRETWVHVYSHAAIKEMQKLIPAKIDRSDYEKRNFGKMYPKGLDKVRTDKRWRMRLDAAVKQSKIKKPGEHIYTMMDELEYAMKDWKKGQTINISDIFNDLSIEILCLSYFGNKFFDQSGKCSYKRKNGSIQKMGLSEMMQEVSDDLDNTYENPLTHHIPPLTELNWTEPFKRDKDNIDEIQRCTAKYLHKTGKRT